jgi:hypothetical protein
VSGGGGVRGVWFGVKVSLVRRQAACQPWWESGCLTKGDKGGQGV